MLVSANDFNNEWLLEFSIRGDMAELNLKSFFEAERRKNPNWFGELSEALKFELRREFEPRGFLVKVVQRRRTFKPDRYILELTKIYRAKKCQCSCVAVSA